MATSLFPERTDPTSLVPRVPTTGALEKRPKTQSSTDLLRLAEEKGFGAEAQSIVQSKGEKTDEIFSGGFISDIFDVLNAAQYGLVGVVKGDGFLEGVKKRRSFSDKDILGEFGIPGWTMGLAMDIALDPLTYITPWTIGSKLGINKLGAAGVKAAKATKAGAFLARKLTWMGGADPLFREAFERMSHGIAGGQQKIKELMTPFLKLDMGSRKALFAARAADDFSKITPEILAKAQPAFQEIDRLSQELVNVGWLTQEMVDETTGKYLPRLFEAFENPALAKQKGFFQGTKPIRANINRLKKKNVDIPDEVLDALGEITEAGYPTAKALIQMTDLVEKGKFFNTVAQSPQLASKVAVEGFTQLPVNKGLGKLSGSFVQAPAADYLNEMVRVKGPTEKVLNKIIGGFKFNKVILNPATHARNNMSNLILNNMEGMNLANPKTWQMYARGGKELATNGEWIRKFKSLGGAGNTFQSQEITNMLLGPEGRKVGGKFKKLWDSTAGKLADLYQGEEEFAKISAFMFHSDNLGAKTIGALDELADASQLAKLDLPAGLTKGDAAMRVAERATFNYAQVSPFVRRLRESVFGMPFITFSALATKQVGRTLAKHPGRLSWIGKVKNDIEKLSDIEQTNKERAAEPQWIRDGFYVKLPMKDNHGRSAYFDLTYIIPFGDLVSGQLFERQINRETGLPESRAEGMLKKAPVINLITEIGKNQDFYGNKIWRDSDSQSKQMADLFRHVAKSYLPPVIADQIPGGFRTKGKKAGQRRPGLFKRISEAGPDSQFRSGTQELLRNIGLKTQPVNLEIQTQYSEWERKKALESLLKEKGVLGEFRRTFISK